VSLRSSPPRARPAAAAPRAPQKIRIIGGVWRRTPIPVAEAPGLRPTPDRVRETLFNWLSHLRPDAAALRGLDLFAGTGALGFELASRGAARVVLVEQQQAQLQRLQALKSRLAAAQVEIVAGEALAAAASLPRASFDLVFLDPPFDSGLLWPAVEASLPLLAPGGLLYVEHDSLLAAVDAAAHGLEVARAARAGRVCFHLLQPRNG